MYNLRRWYPNCHPEEYAGHCIFFGVAVGIPTPKVVHRQHASSRFLMTDCTISASASSEKSYNAHHVTERLLIGYDWSARSDLAQTYAPGSHGRCRTCHAQSVSRTRRQYRPRRTTTSHARGARSMGSAYGTGRSHTTTFDTTC